MGSSKPSYHRFSRMHTTHGDTHGNEQLQHRRNRPPDFMRRNLTEINRHDGDTLTLSDAGDESCTHESGKFVRGGGNDVS
jgi:hypothetical protein